VLIRQVIICGRRLNVVEATAAEINATASGKVIAIEADVSTKEGISAFYDKASQHIDRLDFLVANAGFSAGWRDHSSLANVETLEKKLWSVEDSDFEKMTSIHVSGPYFLSVKFIPLFKKAANPSVCLITSMASFFLNRAVCELSYAQSKAAESESLSFAAKLIHESRHEGERQEADCHTRLSRHVKLIT
jgi:NAD(P)-dependent dehydrogenase (short-subunit alcohol dehydrogenase family)